MQVVDGSSKVFQIKVPFLFAAGISAAQFGKKVIKAAATIDERLSGAVGFHAATVSAVTGLAAGYQCLVLKNAAF